MTDRQYPQLIVCPACGSKLRKRVDVRVEMPLEWLAVDKKHLRQKEVEVLWLTTHNVDIFCPQCGAHFMINGQTYSDLKRELEKQP